MNRPLSQNGEFALAYATYGWPVFPCRPEGKAPLSLCAPNGFKNATTDPDTIKSWWRRFPRANIAVATGAPGPDVLDVDTKKGRDGLALLRRVRSAGLAAEANALIRTPSGGFHIWFHGTSQRGGAVGRLKALELKAVGGYVLLPPSQVTDPDGHYSGTYRIVNRRDTGGYVDFAAIRRLIDPPPRIDRRRLADDGDFTGLIKWMEERPPGDRNGPLYWALCRAIETGADNSVLDQLRDAAVRAGHNELHATWTLNSAKNKLRASA